MAALQSLDETSQTLSIGRQWYLYLQRCKQPKRCKKFRLLIFLNQLYMFRATISLILRNTFWLYIQLLIQCTDIAAGGQQYRCCIHSQKVLIRMGEIFARNMQSWFKKINKRNFLHLVGCLHLFSSDARSHKNNIYIYLYLVWTACSESTLLETLNYLR